jgi:hypothetical protein
VNGGVIETEHLADGSEDFRVLTSCRVRHIQSPSWRPVIAEKRLWAKLPENLFNSALSGQNDTGISG